MMYLKGGMFLFAMLLFFGMWEDGDPEPLIVVFAIALLIGSMLIPF